MENQFLFDLYCHCMESVVCPRDDKIRQVQKLWEQLDDKFTKTMGPPLCKAVPGGPVSG